MNFSTGNTLIDIILLAGGLFMLLKGSEMFVDASAFIARHFNVSEIVIGLTLVSVGTSLPELATNVYASFTGEGEMALGNVVGSNITNMALVLGLGAMLKSELKVPKDMIHRDTPIMLITGVLFFILSSFDLTGKGGTVLGRLDGILLLAGFVIYTLYLFKSKKPDEIIPHEDEEEHHKVNSMKHASMFFIIGLVMITAGSKVVVDSAVSIATGFHVPKEIISATVIAFGTSVPELAVTVTGILKKKSDIAVGNIIGSSIFNIILVMGAAIVIAPITVSSDMISFLLPLMLGTSFILAIFMKTKYRLVRWEGAGLLLIYAFFLYHSVMQSI